MLHAAAALTLSVFAATASAVSVSASQSTVTDLGFFGAGTYQITGSGIVDLVGDGSFPIDPNGKPAPAVTNLGGGPPSYAVQFNTTGSFTADVNFGPTGNVAKFGALAGTFSPAPTMPSQFFLIGTGTTVTLSSPGNIYALVNDTFYGNNTGAFNVTVSAVPEPAQAALLLAGLGVVGLVSRRRSRSS